ALDRAADRVVARARGRELQACARVDAEARVARLGLVGLDAGDAAEEVLAHRAEGEVVERVHARVLESATGVEAVPALPDGGRALIDLPAPAGELLAAHEPAGELLVAAPRELEQQAVRRLHAGREVSAALLGDRHGEL